MCMHMFTGMHMYICMYVGENVRMYAYACM